MITTVVMRLDGCAMAREARRLAKLVLPVDGWPVIIKDGMVDIFDISVEGKLKMVLCMK